jgi:C-terminal processing protease CtpA/Prc
MMKTPILSLLLCLGLTGCGGGGSDPAPPVLPDPVVVVPPTTELPQLPAVPFSDRLPVLQSFFKLAGQVRYHHPGDAVANSNWELLLAESAYLIAAAGSQADAVQVIRNQLSLVAPDLSINGQAGANRQLSANSTVRVLRQNGYVDETPQAGSIYRRERLSVAVNQLGSQRELPAAAQFEYRDALLQAIVPQANLLSGQQTLPAGTAFTRSTRFQIPRTLEHPMVCLATAGEIWSMMANFFPYFSQVNVDWDAELLPLLQSCVNSDRVELEKQLHLSLTKLQDNHIYVLSPNRARWLGSYYTPVRFEWAENKLVAVHKTAQVSDIALGDELIEVNGRPVQQIVDEMSRYALTSSHQAASTVAVEYLLRGNLDTTFQLTLRNASGQLYQSTQQATQNGIFAREVYAKLSQEQLPQFQQLNADIAYVNVSKTAPEQLNTTLNQIRQSKAVVLDLRNYPQSWEGWQSLLAYFARQSMASLPMYYHYANHPDPLLRYQSRVLQSREAQSPRLTQPVVILSSRYSISQNEHALGYAQSIGIPVLGEATAGINGNVTSFQLLGGIENGGLSGMFTGMVVNQHDGSKFIGVGIQPDIPAPLTIAGIRQQKDVQLDAAVRYLASRIGKI